MFDSPLVSVSASGPQGQPKVGDLLTVVLHNGRKAGARLMRIVWGDDFVVRLVGLSTPKPYEIGDRLVLRRDQVVDWSA